MPPKGVFSRIVSTAPFTFLSLIERINLAEFAPAGQLLLHGAAWQSKPLESSSITILGLIYETLNIVKYLLNDFTHLWELLNSNILVIP